jgi:hypothetical protein
MTESDYILIGRKANGEKVYAQASLSYATDAMWRTKTDHTETTERLRLSITGVIVSKYGSIERDGSWIGCGQTLGDLLELTTLAPGWTVNDVAQLHDTWHKWHLNDVNAGCDHQTQGHDSPNCPETGYRWGSKWLYKSIPYGVFAWVSERFEIEPPAPGSKAAL